MNDTDHIAVLRISNNQGYAADQVTNGVTLGDLLEQIQDAVDQYGDDTLVVTKDFGNRYGANWGSLPRFDGVTLNGDDEDEE